MRRARTLLLVLSSVLSAPVLSAQQVAVPGMHVRVLGARKALIATGAFIRLAGDTVVLQDSAGSTQSLSLQPGRRLEVSVGMRRPIERGMGIGVLVGAGVGAVVGAITFKTKNCDGRTICVWEDSRATRAGFGAAYLGVAGIVIGGIAGSVEREWWVPVTAKTLRVVLLSPGLRGAVLAVTTNF